MVFKYIKLTQGKRAKVDSKDFERINKFKWHYYKNRNTEYAKCSYMGGYKTLREAAIAYNGHAKELYGEYAYLNKVA